jgi:hypothetical protein
MNNHQRLRRLEQAVGKPGCMACRDRRGRIMLTTALVNADGTTMYPEGQPAACEQCGEVPEVIIEVVEKLVASADVVQVGALPPSGEDP